MTPSTRPHTVVSATFTTVIAAMLIFSMTAAPILAAAGNGPDINYESEKASPAYIHEDTLTIAEYDRSEMTLTSDQIEYYNDDGEIEELPAHYNEDQDEPVSVRYDRIAASRLNQFPRVSGESGNTYTWLDTGNWTTDSGAGSSMSVNDADGNTASGVHAVEYDASVATGEWANASYETEVNISNDVDKRYLQAFFTVDSLTSSSTVYLVAVDSDGDEKFVEIDDSANAVETGVAANATGNGYVVQERLADLEWNGSGDGSWDELQQVRIAVQENDATITITGLDVEQKSDMNLGETAFDQDGDGDDESVTFQQVNNTNREGYVNLTGLDSLGSWADDASVMDLEVHDVRYSERRLANADDWNATFSDADQYQYPRKLDKDVRLQAPAQIDLSHGNLELRVHQGLVNERYANVEYATDTGDQGFDDINSTTDKTASMTNKSGYVVLTQNINAGNNQYVGSRILLQSGDEDELQSTNASGGGGAPVEDDSGGFLSTAWGKLMAAIGGVLAFLGLRRNSG
jgi:hypothetical protein